MNKTLCAGCIEGPSGEAGHGTLSFQVGGPYPGQSIFRCTSCDARWIRHYGSPAVPFSWSAYSAGFMGRPDPAAMVAT